MDLKKTKKVFNAIYITIFVLLLIFAIFKLLETWLVSIIFILFGVDLFIWRKYWRCPYCKTHLGRMDYSPRCGFCGKKLYKK